MTDLPNEKGSPVVTDLPRTAGLRGLLPPDPSKFSIRLADHLTGDLPAPPPAVNWSARVPSFPMYLNDQLGDCFFAHIGHAIQRRTLYAQNLEVEVPDSAILTAYEHVTGYNPNVPGSDQGTEPGAGMSYWRRTGVGGHKIVAWAAVDPTDQRAVAQAIDLFGGVSLFVSLPADAEAEFEAGQPWADGAGQPIEGGHAVDVSAYSPSGVELITWGARQLATWGWLAAYTQQAVVPITRDWISRAGADPLGATLGSLGEQFAELTGEPNPFVPRKRDRFEDLVDELRRLLA